MTTLDRHPPPGTTPSASHHGLLGVGADDLAERPSATGHGRITALDGLRAVAVGLVLAFHFGLGGLGGGFFGVDVFYVLSGFLITGLLLAERERTGRIRLGAFWTRRARRLLPALVLVVVTVAVLVRFAAPAGRFPGFRGDALSALFYVSNWWQVAKSADYFAVTAATSPLTHTWSLAVEEQFYLVWPLVVLAVLAMARGFLRGVRALIALSVVGALASAAAMALWYRPGASTTRLYFGTDTHAQSVLVGAALACLLTLVARHRGEAGMDPVAHRAGSRRALSVAGVVGIAVVVAAAVALGAASPATWRGGFLVVALATAAVVAAVVVVPAGPLARVLSLRPLVWVGTISYGIYLWHFPVGVFLDGARTGLSGLPLGLVRTAVTVVVSAASFALVERPILEGRFWRTPRSVAVAAGAVAATVAVVVVSTVGTAAPEAAGTPSGLAGSRATAAGWEAVHVDRFASTRQAHVLLVGDSLALTVGVGMARYAAAYGLELGGRSHTGCGVATALPLSDHGVVGDPFGNCQTWPTWWADDIAQLHPQVVGLIIGFWEVQDRMVDGRWQHLGQPGFDAYETAQLERAVALLTSGGARLALFTAPYFQTGEQPDGSRWPQDDPARVDRLNALLAQVAARHPGSVALIPLHRYLDPGGRFTWTIGGAVVRQGDGVHTTVAGGAYLAPLVLPQLAALAHSTSGR